MYLYCGNENPVQKVLKLKKVFGDSPADMVVLYELKDGMYEGLNKYVLYVPEIGHSEYTTEFEALKGYERAITSWPVVVE